MAKQRERELFGKHQQNLTRQNQASNTLIQEQGHFDACQLKVEHAEQSLDRVRLVWHQNHRRQRDLMQRVVSASSARAERGSVSSFKNNKVVWCRGAKSVAKSS